MIRDLKVDKDGAKFPVVSWVEDRGSGSPAGTGSFRMECRIAKEPKTGVLMFIARGHMRNRPFESGLPWEDLISFATTSAVHHYLEPVEQQMRENLLSKTKTGKILMGDGGRALLAQFKVMGYFDIGCPEAAQIDLDRLGRTLTQKFVDERRDLVDDKCKIEEYRWPPADASVETYDPDRKGWPDEKPLSRLHEALMWLGAVGAVVGVVALLLWLLRLITI